VKFEIGEIAYHVHTNGCGLLATVLFEVFLWGMQKGKVYINRPHTVDDLKQTFAKRMQAWYNIFPC
jgi:hypothetical protein